jgi:hypothetical protein
VCTTALPAHHPKPFGQQKPRAGMLECGAAPFEVSLNKCIHSPNTTVKIRSARHLSHQNKNKRPERAKVIYP